MRGEIWGPVAGAIHGAILPRGASATTLLWSIAGTTQITEEAADATYTVSYVNAMSPGQSATIAVASAAGAATDGVDYTGAATTLTFTAGGATAKTLAATIIEDTIVEGAEDFRVTLASPSVGQLATSQVTTSIADEDASLLAWSISGPTSVDEGDAGTYTVGYTGATLAPGQQATVTVATASGALSWPDASAGSDYTALSTVLTFTGGGVTATTVAVSTIDDTDVEGTEDFRVTIGGVSGGSLAVSQANTAIADGYAGASTFLLDSVSGTAVQAYSMRKLRAAYAGNCVRLRRSTDGAESDFGFNGSGDLDTEAIASWLGAASGSVMTWYDQSGNGRNAEQAHVLHQPSYGASLINAGPAIGFVSNDRFAMSRPSPSATWTSFAVVKKDNAADGMVLCDNVQNRQHRINASGGANVSLYAGTMLSLAYGGDVTVPHLYEWENRGSNVAQIWVDGSSLGTGDPGTGSLGSDEIGTLTVGSAFINGKIAEVIVFHPNLSGGDRTMAEADIMSYWGL